MAAALVIVGTRNRQVKRDEKDLRVNIICSVHYFEASLVNTSRRRKTSQGLVVPRAKVLVVL